MDAREKRPRNGQADFLEKAINPLFKEGADDGTRTHDLLITNQLLYQLSYIGDRASGR